MKPVPLIDKVAEGCSYYVKKYARLPDVCIVHPDDVSRLPIQPPNKIKVDGHEMTVYSWAALVTESVWLGLAGPAEPQPKTVKPDSEVVSAFIQHAQKVSS